jgi:hypothetical protein
MLSLVLTVLAITEVNAENSAKPPEAENPAKPPEAAKKNYIFQSVYGGDKAVDIFKNRSEQAIQWALNSIIALVIQSQNENKPLRSYYTDFLGDQDKGLGKFRRDIAFETGTNSKDVFGIHRLKDTGHLLDYTPIRISWRDDLVSYFTDLLKHLNQSENDHIVHLKSMRSHNDLHIVDQDYCLDENNIPLSREILINHYKYDPAGLTDDIVKELAMHEAISMDELFFGPPSSEIKRDLRTLQRNKNALKILKYQMKLKIGENMVPISVIYGMFQADTLKQNGVSDASIEKMTEKSHFIVMHTPRKNVPTLMQEVELYFENAIQCAHNDITAIKTNLANLFYIQSHAMPFSRGSEAITKWILEVVARYHGYTIVYPADYPFQSPFHSTIDDFVNDFVQRVQFAAYLGNVNQVPAQ